MSSLNTIKFKAFVPANDFVLAKKFYQDLGFSMLWDSSGGLCNSWPLFVALQHGVCAVVISLPAAALGVAFPLAWWVTLLTQGAAGRQFGRLCGTNINETFHSSLAASSVFVLRLRPRATLMLANCLSASAGAPILWRTLTSTALLLVILLGLPAAVGAQTLTTDLTGQRLPTSPRWELLYYREDGSGVVEVMEDKATGVRSLLMNRLRQEGVDSVDNWTLPAYQGIPPLHHELRTQRGKRTR